MCQNNALDLLATCPEGYAGHCEGCGHYTVAFKNAMLLFSVDDLLFSDNVLKNRQGMWRVDKALPQGKTWVLAPPDNNLFLAFTSAEFGLISDCCTEDRLLVEARRIVRRAA
ncbi:MAG: hypothetical protein H7Y12_12285 [Sphingobacteriaceae bacterium]|nr:hypothetical protein [Cytophagaceae bacterium]